MMILYSWQTVVMRYFITALLFCIIHFAYSEPVAWDGPGQVGWSTLSSEHFQIHYPDDEDYAVIALRSLAIAEKAHSDFLPFFGQAPKQKTQMVLSDDNDFSNGWATFFPFAQIRLYLTPPSSVTGLENYDDWLSLLIRHEYVHVLHLDMANGLPKKGRSVLGRFPGSPYLPSFFPHSLTSPMLIEGLAVYLETDYQQGTGRLASSWYQMLMQEEVHSEHFADFNQAIITTKDWPYGQHYLYGAFFIEYLAQTYGEEAIQQWLQDYSYEIVPWFMQNRVAKKVFDKTFNQLWDDFTLAMKARFEKTEPYDDFKEKLYEKNASVRLQVAASNGHSAIYIVRNDRDRPVLKHCFNHLDCRELATVGVDDVSSLDMNHQQEVVAVRQIRTAGGRVLADVFMLENGAWKPLSQNLRASRVKWEPHSIAEESGQLNFKPSVIVSSIDKGRSKLSRLSVSGKQTLLWQGEYGDVIGEFALHPSGEFLIAAKKSLNGHWNLAKFDLVTQVWQPVTQTRATESSPTFTAEGQLVFVADYEGRFNLYQQQPDGTAIALTHALTGAFTPLVLQDYLVYQAYTAEGFEFRSIGLNQGPANAAQPIPLLVDEPVNQNKPLPDISTKEAEPYTPWSTLRPYYWLPFWRYDDDTSYVGFSTRGSDALQRHNYYLKLEYDTDDDLLNADLVYRYQQWFAALSLDYTKLSINPDEPRSTIVKEEQAVLQRNWLYRALEDDFGIHAGIVHRKLSLEELEPGIELIGSDQVSETSLGLAATLNHRGYLFKSPGIGYGSYSHVVVEDFNLIANDSEGLHLQAGWDYTFDLAGQQAVTLAILGGFASDQAPGWELGGLPPEEDNSLFGRDQLSLRGYDSGIQRGQYYERESLSYRTKLAELNRNWSIWPVGIAGLDAATYLQRGRAWSDGQNNDALVGLGAELRLKLILGYRLHVPLVVGVAKGLDERLGEEQFYAGVQVSIP